MGSSIICEKGILCCSHPGINAQKSDLFVPQISLKIKKKTTQKKIKSLKTYTLNKKLGLGRMTTERIITNTFGSGTMKFNARIKERWKYSSKYYNKLNNSKEKEEKKTPMDFYKRDSNFSVKKISKRYSNI